MYYFEKQKEEFERTYPYGKYGFNSSSLDNNGAGLRDWAKKECKIDFSDYIKMLIDEAPLTNVSSIKIAQDIVFQVHRVKRGI